MVNIYFSCENNRDEQHESAYYSTSAASWTISDSILQTNPFSIQIAALTERENARQLLRQLQQAGLDVFLITNSNILNKTIFRLRVGPFQNRKKTKDILAQVIALGYDGAFITRHSAKSGQAVKPMPDENIQLSGVENIKQITQHTNCSHPDWSPSGREIAFFRTSVENSGIYSVGTAGGAISHLAENDRNFEVTAIFAWSPDGKQLAFVAREPNKMYDWADNLYVVNSNGIKPKRVLQQEWKAFTIANIVWSPASSYLAVDINSAANEESSQLRQIILIPLVEDEQRFRLGDWESPVWSAGWRSENEFIYLGSVNGQNDYGDSFREDNWEAVLFELNTAEITVLHSSAVKQKITQTGYLTRGNTLVFSALIYPDITGRRLVLVDLFSGNENILFEQTSPNTSMLVFQISQNEQILFVEENKLWLNANNGREALIQLPAQITEWTMGPYGKRFCFAQNKELFIGNFKNSAF